MKLTFASVGPFLLPVAMVAAAVWLGRGSEQEGPRRISDVLKPEPGTIRIALQANPPNLDPIEMTDTTSDSVVERICNTLVRLDTKLRVIPDLAEALPDRSPDGLVYTFRLRKGVKFQNGREMTSEDVKYSLTRLAEPWSKRFEEILSPVKGAEKARSEMISRGMHRGDPQTPVEGIETPDRYTVRITLDHENLLFPYFLAMNNASVVPMEEVKALGQKFGRQLSGTGPFRLVEWKDNDRLVLERFDGYFGRKPSLDRIVFKVMPEEETAYQGYLNGELDLIQCPTGKVALIRGSNLRDQLIVNPLLDVRYHGINMEAVLRDEAGALVPFGGNPEKANPPVNLTPEQRASALKVRQAMNCAVNRKFLCEVILESRAVPAKGAVPPGMQGFNPDLRGYDYDPERARRLLAEAGYPGGRGLPPIPYYFNNQGPNARIAQALQGMFLDVGIHTDLRQMDWGAVQNLIDEGKAEFFRLAWIADYPDPENFLWQLFHSRNKGGEGNNARLQDPETDRMLDEARTCLDDQRRMELWKKAEQRIVDQAPWVFLYFQATALLVKPYVKGLELSSMDVAPEIPQADLTKVRIEPGAR